MRMALRHVDFIGETSFPQGYGMTWDDLDIVVDLKDGEQISFIETSTRAGGGFDGLVPAVRVWIRREVAP